MAEEVDKSLFPNGSSDLQDAEAIWGEGTKAAELPVGNFTCQIKGAVLGRSTSSDRLQVCYDLEILGPTDVGKKLKKFDGLGSPQQAGITQQQLKRLGVDVKKVSLKTLPATLLTLVNKNVLITAKQNGEFHNIFFQKIAPTNIASPTAGAAGKAGKASGKKF